MPKTTRVVITSERQTTLLPNNKLRRIHSYRNMEKVKAEIGRNRKRKN